jgi:hypothetical protein
MSVQDGGGAALAAPPSDDFATPAQIGLIGCTLLFLFALLVYVLVAIWPTKTSYSSASAASPAPSATAALVPTLPGQNAGEWNPRARLFGMDVVIPSDIRFLLLVALSGALGSFVQIATSFTAFLGNRNFRRSWIWWYVLRVPIGVALAWLFYFAVRGGFFTSVSSTDINPFGIAALGGLVGMFSKQASNKLQDVFTELFKSEQDAALADKLTGAAPVITATAPSAVTTASTKVTLAGSGFAQGATATINGVAQDTQFVDAQTLVVTLPSNLQAGTALSIVVTNPGSGAPSSPAYTATVAQ